MSFYSDALLQLSRDASYARLPDRRTHEARWANPLCGDTVVVGAEIVDGRLQSLGFEAQACAVCVASAAAMAQALHGAPAADLAVHLARLEQVLAGGDAGLPSELAALLAVRPFRSRHACLLLPWRALEQALVGPPLAADADSVPRGGRAPAGWQGHTSPWLAALQATQSGARAMLATLIEVEGSSPCPVGSRMVITSSGEFWGSVSGGCVESAVVQVAVASLSAGSTAARVEEYQISNSQAGEVGLPCGGRIKVLVGPCPPAAELEARATLPTQALCVTNLATGEGQLVAGDELGPDGRAVLEDGVARLVTLPDGEAFLERLGPAERLVLVGGTHIAQKLARLAEEVGLEVVVVDPRPAVANPARFGTTRIVNARPEDALAELLTPSTSVVMLTHDAAIDDPALRIALTSRARYVAALGSRKTQQARLARLAEAGLSAAQLARLRGPAGLAIGATGAGEIALSILAEVVAERRLGARTLPRIAAVILAGGASRRAGAQNKLLREMEGTPMVRRVVQTAIEAGVSRCVVVLGHEADLVRAALDGLDVRFVYNELHAQGMGTSIACGIRAVGDVDAALVMLGDMPLVRPEDLERLIAAHQPSTQHLIIAPEAGRAPTRRLGNPVLWPRRYFGELEQLCGDAGAKHIMLRAPGAVLRVPVDHDGVLRDFDTDADLQASGVTQ